MEMQAITAPLLPYARDFKFMFAKDNFDILLEYYHQNYIIELLPDSKPRSTKVYLLSSIEQKKLNTFLEENLCTGWIYLSKLPIVALVFFIKKKNSSLQLVQDYWALNSMIMKNKYSLLLISKLVLQLYRAKYFTKLDILVMLENEVLMDSVKVARVQKWSTPELQTNIQAFLGFVNFYQHFIQDFSAIAQSLFNLTYSNQVQKWKNKEQTAFKALKIAMTSTPVLVLPQNSEPFQIEANSSDYATGTILSQLL